jgi:hypothetical protein
MQFFTFRFSRHVLSSLALVAAGCVVSAADFTTAKLPLANVDAPLSFYGFATGNELVRSSFANTTFGPVIAPPLNPGVFDIVIAPGASLAANAAALAAFNRAAAAWESRISDPITITIDANLGVGFGMIGSTSSVVLQGGFNEIRDHLVADAAGHASDSIIASLPTAEQFSAKVPDGVTLDGNLIGTKASLKAMGFEGLDTLYGVSDASIIFNTDFSFDFDRSDGLTPGTIDFETVAEHEIGHALGFFSIVDSIDSGALAIGPTVLDLFRFSRGVAGEDPASANDFTTFQRNLIPGADTNSDDIANEYRMSTGVTKGDGHQAGHWKDDELTGQYIGIMDPTLANGTFELATETDFRALDLIGYDVVPEPSAFAALLAGGMGLLGMRRARRRQLARSRFLNYPFAHIHDDA